MYPTGEAILLSALQHAYLYAQFQVRVIVDALTYLHQTHIVHGDLKAVYTSLFPPVMKFDLIFLSE